VDIELVGLAFGAGLVAALNPCGFAMLPGYLALVVRGTDSRPLPAVGRALAATIAMALGFLTVFATFGLLTVSVAAIVQRYVPYVTVAIGVVLVVLGISLLTGRELWTFTGFTRASRWAPTARIGSMFGYGMSYAVASLSCTAGPFLAVTAVSLRRGSSVEGLSVYFAYGAGMTLVVGALAVGVAFANSAVADHARRVLPFVRTISGVLVALIGVYVGYYGFYEVRLFGANANPRDPVIVAAARLQGRLAVWVHQHGALPWLLVLALPVLGAVVVAWRKRARRSGQSLGCGE
jgi:cytochrome c biogenesis protein CcdA